MLPVETDDEHGAGVPIAFRLAGGENWCQVTLRSDVSDALAEAAVAEFFGTAEEVNGTVGAVGGEQGFHGAVVLVAEGQDVRPHAKTSVAPGGEFDR